MVIGNCFCTFWAPAIHLTTFWGFLALGCRGTHAHVNNMKRTRTHAAQAMAPYGADGMHGLTQGLKRVFSDAHTHAQGQQCSMSSACAFSTAVMGGGAARTPVHRATCFGAGPSPEKDKDVGGCGRQEAELPLKQVSVSRLIPTPACLPSTRIDACGCLTDGRPARCSASGRLPCAPCHGGGGACC